MRRVPPSVALPFALSILFGIGWLVFDRIAGSASSIPGPVRPGASRVAESPDDSAGHTGGEDAPPGAIAQTAEAAEPAIPHPTWRTERDGPSPRPALESQAAAAQSKPPPSTPAVPAPGTAGGSPAPASGPNRTHSRRPPPQQPSDARSNAAREPSPRTTADKPDRESDTEAPVLVGIGFVPPEIRDGGESGVSITATDDLSGVRAVSGSLRSPGSGATVGFAAHRQGSTDSWAARIGMPVHAEEGTWVVSQLRLQDNANNVRWINWDASSAPPGARLNVVSTNADSSPPTVISIAVARTSINRGETNAIQVRVEDDKSGVGSVYGMFSSPGGAANVSFHCRPSNDLWVGDIQLPPNADCGVWTLRSLSVADKANNRATLPWTDERIRNVVFTLAFTGQCDSTPPVVSLVSLAPTLIDNGQDATIAVQALVTDDATGVRAVTGRVAGPAPTSGQPPTINFAFKPGATEHEPWSATFVVPRYSAKGRWTIQAIQAIDKANNRRTYSPADPVLMGIGFDVN